MAGVYGFSRRPPFRMCTDTRFEFVCQPCESYPRSYALRDTMNMCPATAERLHIADASTGMIQREHN